MGFTERRDKEEREVVGMVVKGTGRVVTLGSRTHLRITRTELLVRHKRDP